MRHYLLFYQHLDSFVIGEGNAIHMNDMTSHLGRSHYI